MAEIYFNNGTEMVPIDFGISQDAITLEGSIFLESFAKICIVCVNGLPIPKTITAQNEYITLARVPDKYVPKHYTVGYVRVAGTDLGTFVPYIDVSPDGGIHVLLPRGVSQGTRLFGYLVYAC